VCVRDDVHGGRSDIHAKARSWPFVHRPASEPRANDGRLWDRHPPGAMLALRALPNPGPAHDSARRSDRESQKRARSPRNPLRLNPMIDGRVGRVMDRGRRDAEIQGYATRGACFAPREPRPSGRRARSRRGYQGDRPTPHPSGRRAGRGTRVRITDYSAQGWKARRPSRPTRSSPPRLRARPTRRRRSAPSDIGSSERSWPSRARSRKGGGTLRVDRGGAGSTPWQMVGLRRANHAAARFRL
jgi:hypothetical protein